MLFDRGVNLEAEVVGDVARGVESWVGEGALRERTMLTECC